MTSESLPTGRGFSKETVANNFVWYRGTQSLELGIKVLVPRGWKLSDPEPNKPMSSLTLKTLALFSSEQENNFLHIQAVQLEKEITSELWLRNFMIVADYSPDNLLAISSLFADSLSDLVISGQALRGRVAARINGNILFLVSGLCRAQDYPDYAEIFGVCIASFSPMTQYPSRAIEERKHAGVETLISFEYPASWQAKPVPPIPGKNAVDLVAAVQGLPSGLIRVKTVVKSATVEIDMQFEDALAEFADAGLIEAVLETKGNVEIFSDRFSSGILQIFRGNTSANNSQELWIVVLEDINYFVTVTLLTPDRRNEFLLWAWNKCALDIVTQSLQ